MTPTEELIEAGRAVMRKGLTWGTSGNVSVRAVDGKFLISASGAALDEGTIIRCSLEDAAWSEGGRPSVEAGMHRLAYTRRPDVGAVIHASPPHTTLIACSEVEVDPLVMSDTTYYVRRVTRVPVMPPGSVELAAAVGDAIGDVNCLILDNHGCLVVGETPRAAVVRLEALELLCRTLVFRSLGFPLRSMTPEQAHAFVGGPGARSRGRPFHSMCQD